MPAGWFWRRWHTARPAPRSREAAADVTSEVVSQTPEFTALSESVEVLSYAVPGPRLTRAGARLGPAGADRHPDDGPAPRRYAADRRPAGQRGRAGGYGAVVQIPEFALVIVNILAATMGPLMAKCIGDGASAQFQSVYQQVYDGLLVFILPAFAAGTVLARPIVSLMLSVQYVDFTPEFQFMVWAAGLMHIAGMLGVAAVTLNLQRLVASNSATSAVHRGGRRLAARNARGRRDPPARRHHRSDLDLRDHLPEDTLPALASAAARGGSPLGTGGRCAAPADAAPGVLAR